jgi:malate dehydrogenase (oxaloacetate-decarboxylating)
MENLNINLTNLGLLFPPEFTEEQIAKAKTLFFKRLSEKAHRFYVGKMQTIPKIGVRSCDWLNVWYTPGVSEISTTIRENNEASYELTNRGNLVAIVSDSTRVLGDGDCTPSGGLGVMEGKAFLMKILGGIDAVALCIDSTNDKGENDPYKIIDFVKMVQHSFGAINLEDISQPNCYQVLDTLREEALIPVWHDDGQGTACVTLAGVINALKLVNKKMEEAKIVYLGAGAANTTTARILHKAGANVEKMILFDSAGALHKGRKDIKSDPKFYRKWELCKQTNPKKIEHFEEAMTDADILIALSKPGPKTIKPAAIQRMAKQAIVFACANPIPEIYPYAAKEAGAVIVATGRGDFPNQVNNSLGFPGILKGTLTVRAKKVTDKMAIAAAHSLANFAEKRGIDFDNIIPSMNETEVFAQEAADVAMQAIKEGVARISMSWQEVYDKTASDIRQARGMTRLMVDNNFILPPPEELLQECLHWAISEVS